MSAMWRALTPYLLIAALVMLAAAIAYARRGEVTGIVPNAALGAIALFVAGGRFVAVPF